ncbi:MAG: TlpA disulfide reductase family protein [Pyrinomonadaceae bacterium]
MKRILAVTLISISLCIAASAQTSLKIGEQAPAFSAASMDGTNYDLNELRGSIVVMTFWSTKCEICRHEFPKVNQLVQTYNARNVVFLALTMENEEKVETYLRKNSLASQILPNSFGIVLKYADRTRDGSLDMGFPSFFVIDQNGLIQYRSSGFNKTSALSSTIERLAGKQAAVSATP